VKAAAPHAEECWQDTEVRSEAELLQAAQAELLLVRAESTQAQAELLQAAQAELLLARAESTQAQAELLQAPAELLHVPAEMPMHR